MDMPIPLYGVDVRARALLVLAYLWTYVRVNPETKMPASLFVWPSRAKMARELRMAETAISREAKILEKAGLLVREKRDDQGRKRSGYLLTLSPVLPMGHAGVTPVSRYTGVTGVLPIGHGDMTPESQERDTSVTRTRKNKKEQEGTKSTANDTAPLGELIPQAVLDGLCDSRPEIVKTVAFRRCMIAWHCRLWGANPNQFSATASKLVKAADTFTKDGRLPSLVLKAQRGMRADDWTLRAERNGWEYLMRHFERWVNEDARASAPATQSQGVESWS